MGALQSNKLLQLILVNCEWAGFVRAYEIREKKKTKKPC